MAEQRPTSNVALQGKMLLKTIVSVDVTSGLAPMQRGKC